VEHGEVHGPLHRELKAPVPQQPVERRVQTQFFPKTAEHQVRADISQGSGLQASFLIILDDPDLGGKTTQGFQQDVNTAAFGEFIGPPQRGQDPLHSAFAFPMVLHDLEIAVRAFGFDSDKHAAPPSGHRNYARVFPLKSSNLFAKSAIFSAPHFSNFQMPVQ
jgi:hypothetical protein